MIHPPTQKKKGASPALPLLPPGAAGGPLPSAAARRATEILRQLLRVDGLRLREGWCRLLRQGSHLRGWKSCGKTADFLRESEKRGIKNRGMQIGPVS